MAVGATALALLAATGSAAHVPYLLPSTFNLGKATHITLQSAFTEDPFIPEVVLKSDFFFVRGPDGTQAPLGTPTYLRQLTVLECATPNDGTYLFSTGPRQGRNGKMYKGAGGKWLMVGEESATLPAGAETVEVQSITTAEAYVTRGAPTLAALATRGVGLELKPITHPSDISPRQAIRFQLLFDGKPLGGQVVHLQRVQGNFDGQKVPGQATTAADGTFALTAPDAGLYMTLIRYRTASPAGAATPFRSYTHTLSFEAAE